MDGGKETLADASEREVNKFLSRRKRRNNEKTEDSAQPSSKRSIWSGKDAPRQDVQPSSACGAPAAMPESAEETMEKTAQSEEDDDIEWEDGGAGEAEGWNGQVTFEEDASRSTRKKIPRRRANAKDKEFAEIVHKAHLLCLIARGRLVDAACDDPTLRALLLSIVPPRLISSTDAGNPQLQLLVKWFCGVFRLGEGSYGDLRTRLKEVIAKQTGSEEELAAVAVAMFRALGYSTRYVCVLDATSVKPDAESLEASKDWDGRTLNRSTLSGHLKELVATARRTVKEPNFAPSPAVSGLRPRSPTAAGPRASPRSPPASVASPISPPAPVASLPPETTIGTKVETPEPAKRKRNSKKAPGEAVVKPEPTTKRRKGDEEFELELARAIAATEAIPEKKMAKEQGSRKMQETPKELKAQGDKSARASNMLHWGRNRGPLLSWAEVYSGSEESGRWIHVDAVRDIVDGPENVEASAGRQPVRYVVAFSGMGAKDVTRRYTYAWSKIAKLRVEETWWNMCIFPLREIQAAAHRDRSTREDMELETRAYTEPLPSNQQEYRNHHLYALERWLTRYQILHPKGPVIGYCGGKAVYPRSCVQELHTKEGWLKECFAVKEGEQPVKTIKSRQKNTPRKETPPENINDEEPMEPENGESPGLVHLYGKWQTEPWEPPPVVNGIVPRNERGQIDVWSEKCIPAGGVHLRFPRLGPIAQDLKVSFAPAMVGFEFRQGRSVPIYDGIVVPEESKDAILEVYTRQERRRLEEIERKKEQEAALRWRQLIRSIATRERLRAAYQVDARPSEAHAEATEQDRICEVETLQVTENHIHNFSEQDYDKETCIRTKRCACGYQIQVEEI